MPTSYVVGEHDQFGTPAHIRRLAQRIGADVHEIPDAGHLPWYDKPDLTVNAILHSLTLDQQASACQPRRPDRRAPTVALEES